MNKKLLTVAVAAAMVAPMTVMAASNVTLYGRAHISQDYIDADSNASKFDGWDTASRASRVGVKGSEDLGGGNKAIFKMEFQVAMTDNNDDINDNDQGSIKMRNSYVGLAGDWGTAVIGRHDTPLKISTARLELFHDRLADYNETVKFLDVRADNAVAYISPTFFGGLTLSGAGITPGGSVVVDQGTGKEEEADGWDAWSFAAMYSNGPFYLSAAYERYSDDMLLQEDAANALRYDLDDFSLWRIGAGFTWRAFTINGIYEGHQDDPTALEAKNNEADTQDPYAWQIQGQWKFGNNVIKAMYGEWDGDDANVGSNAEDQESYAIGFDHNFSKRTTAYLLWTDVDNDEHDADYKGGSLGLIHNF